jgi:hypothetical protein
VIHFFREANPEWNQDVHVFRGIYNGPFAETKEMRPHLRNIEAIPYDDMREDDILWMQKLIT